MNETTTPPTSPRRPLRRFLKISLSTLLVLVAVLAVWLARVTNRARLQGQVFAELKALKCQVEFDYQHPELDPALRKRGARLTVQNRTKAEPPGPLWARRLLGDEYFRTLVWVSYYGRLIPRPRPGVDTSRLGPRHDDELMQKLGALGTLRSLMLSWCEVGEEGLASAGRLRQLHSFMVLDCPNVTDAGIAQMEKLPLLEIVNLNGLSITDRSLASLAKLPRMRNLVLNNCPITDAGLAFLRSAPKLDMLVLETPAITDAGLAHLRGLANLTNLQVTSDKITEAGFEHMTTPENLKILVVRQAPVCDDWLAHLEKMKQLTMIEITPAGPPLTDCALEHFKKLPDLATLSVGNPKHPATQFSDEAVRALLVSLPKLKVLFLEPANLKPEFVAQLKQIRPGLRIGRVFR